MNESADAPEPRRGLATRDHVEVHVTGEQLARPLAVGAFGWNSIPPTLCVVNGMVTRSPRYHRQLPLTHATESCG